MEDRCIMCGAIIPEGRQVCPVCELNAGNRERSETEMKVDWKRKLTSRKFWACVVNFVSQLLIMLRVDENSATQAVALIMAGAGVIAYIIGEGLTDAAAAGYEDGPETEPPEMER